MKEDIQRIERMEKSFDRAQRAVKKLEKALAGYSEVSEDIRALEDYYGSEAYMADLLADERGELPEGLKRGILSEDGLWNFLEDVAELRRTMREMSEE